MPFHFFSRPAPILVEKHELLQSHGLPSNHPTIKVWGLAFDATRPPRAKGTPLLGLFTFDGGYLIMKRNVREVL